MRVVRGESRDEKTGRLCVFVSGLSVTTGSVSREQHQLIFREADKGSGATWQRRNTPEQSEAGQELRKKAYDSLLYPLAIGGHIIQSILHADAHVLNGIKLVHEAFSFRVLQ